MSGDDNDDIEGAILEQIRGDLHYGQEDEAAEVDYEEEQPPTEWGLRPPLNLRRNEMAIGDTSTPQVPCRVSTKNRTKK